jgi:hypothetical protein
MYSEGPATGEITARIPGIAGLALPAAPDDAVKARARMQAV